MIPINIGVSTWNPAASYGRIATETKNYLEERGYWVNTIGRQHPKDEFRPGFHSFLIGYPTNYAAFGNITEVGRRVSFSTFETSKIPPGWSEILNQCSSMIVPCSWNERVYRECGVTIPIHMVPHGISKAFKYVKRPKRDIFRFITIADRGHRKGYLEAISAFVKNFGKNQKVELIIKARELDRGSQLLKLSNPNIRVINQELSDEEMLELYQECDCMILPARGEGFGWPPREFAASGGISICTNFGGLADELPNWGIGIKYEIAPAWPIPPTDSPHFYHLGEWAEPDVDDLADRMLEIYEMDYNCRIEMGKQFSDFCLGFYTWDKHGSKVEELLFGGDSGN